MRYSKFFMFFICCSMVFGFFSADLSAQAKEAVIKQEAGIIKGVVKTPWVEHYQALVYIDRVEGKEFSPPKENPHISQKGMVFTPHILAVLRGTTVSFTNDDTIQHNVFGPPRGSAKRFNLGKYGIGVKKAVNFNRLGEVPLLCNIHTEMSGFVVILQNPYYAFTNEKGAFEIKDVPPGTYRLKVWHEKLKEVSQEVVVEPGKAVFVEFRKKELKPR